MVVIELPYRPVEPGRPLHDELLKSVGHTELAVDYDGPIIAQPFSEGLYDTRMASGGYGAEVVTVVFYRRRGGHLRESPVAGFGKGPDGGVGSLTEEDKDT